MVVTTRFTEAEPAARDLAQKLNSGDTLAFRGGAEVEYDDRLATWTIRLDVADSAAVGFLDGRGLFGYDGFGPLGPVLGDCEGVTVSLVDPLTIAIYAKQGVTQ